MVFLFHAFILYIINNYKIGCKFNDNSVTITIFSYIIKCNGTCAGIGPNVGWDFIFKKIFGY